VTTTKTLRVAPADAAVLLPATARVWVYRVAIVLGALVFLAAIVLKATGHGTIDGVSIDPETGIVALVLAGLGALAHANLANGPAILDAIEGTSPKVTEVVDAAEKVADKAHELATEDPDLTKLLRADLIKLLPPGVTPGKKTKAELIEIITSATRKA
jgi:hypothetical protein